MPYLGCHAPQIFCILFTLALEGEDGDDHYHDQYDEDDCEDEDMVEYTQVH